ncbi:MAG: methyl-accepting chemotaxis protein [Candidatus Fibromonas sp.]|nr:methyl-accepting chemotaxis protein [Candidatus Fibromonas sp.]
MSFYQRMILSMLAVLLLFALINGLLVYSMIKSSDSENIAKFNEILRKSEDNSIETWLGFARSVIYPYVALSKQYPDSTTAYQNKVLDFLRETNWSSDKKHHGFYFIFDAKTGNAILFRDTIGRFIPQNANVLETEDIKGKKFVKEITENAYKSDDESDTSVTFTYSKPCLSCPPIERMAKGIYIEDWDWIVATGGYTDNLVKATEIFSKNFNDNRLNLMGNLLGIMLISFLIGLFMVFRQMNSFVVPLRSLSNYIHRLANEGIRFEDFNINAKSQSELRGLADDLNSLVRNVGSFIDNVRVSADGVSSLSGACADMLDIVDFDAKLVGQRTAEMKGSSEEVVDNVKSMAKGIEEININLDGLKRLSSHVAENTTDIKSSISQMSEAMKDLNEKSSSVQHNVMSVTQAVNDIEVASSSELSKINNISVFATELQNGFEKMAGSIGEFRKYTTQCVRLITGTTEKSDQDRKESSEAVKNMCEIVEGLYHQIMSIQIQFADLRDNQIVPLASVVEERKNLSKEISSDALELKDSIVGMVGRIAEINSSSQYINSSVKHVSSDINEAYRNVDEVFIATDTMNEHAKQVRVRMDEFSLKSKKVEEAHSAIAHTLVDAKDSMKTLLNLSNDLRKVVEYLVLQDKAQQIEVTQV